MKKTNKILTLTLACAMAAITVLPTPAMAASYRVSQEKNLEELSIIEHPTQFESTDKVEKKYVEDLDGKTFFTAENKDDYSYGNVQTAIVNLCKYYFDKDQAKYGSLCKDSDISWGRTSSRIFEIMYKYRNSDIDIAASKTLEEYFEEAGFEGSIISNNISINGIEYEIANNKPVLVFSEDAAYVAVGYENYVYPSRGNVAGHTNKYLRIVSGTSNYANKYIKVNKTTSLKMVTARPIK